MFFVDKFRNKYKCDYCFDNVDTLIVSGGALKCIYTLGGISKLDLSKIQQCAATSCGTMIITLISMGYTPFEIFKEFLAEPPNAKLTTILDIAITRLSELFENKGFERNITFQEFYNRTGKTLAFVATNVTLLSEEIFSHTTFPNAPIIEGIRLSCSLPIIFPIARYNGHIYTDGIFFDNFPIKLHKMFPNSNGVVAFSTSSSYYDTRICKYYKDPKKYKIILVPDYIQKHFRATRDEKFCMYISGVNFVTNNLNRATKYSRRKRRHSV